MEALSLNLTERRVAKDGAAYTFAEYADFYGFQSALTLWQTSNAQQPACSAARPAQSSEEGFTWHLQNILEATAQYSEPVGRNEVSMALATILQSYSPQQFPFAVDITDTVAFPWHRWLRNVVENRELIGCGIVKVCALWHADATSSK